MVAEGFQSQMGAHTSVRTFPMTAGEPLDQDLGLHLGRNPPPAGHQGPQGAAGKGGIPNHQHQDIGCLMMTGQTLCCPRRGTAFFRNAVRTSRAAYTSVNPRGEGLASMVHLSQDDKPEKVAWSAQPQLRHAIDHVSMLAQGVKKIDKVAKTPLCEHTSRESSQTKSLTGRRISVSR